MSTFMAQNLGTNASFVRVVTIVGAILAALTLIEFLFAIGIDNTPFLVTTLSVVALGKAVLIIWFFMHLYALWQTESH